MLMRAGACEREEGGKKDRERERNSESRARKSERE